MSNFDRALAFVFGVEGGYSNDPDDHGGPTRFGVTQATYDGYRAAVKLPTQEVSEITRDEATAIYRTNFWDVLGCEKLPWPLAVVVFDAAVNHGPGNAKRFLNDATWAAEPVTVQAYAVLCLRRSFYRDIISKRPDQSKWLAGWLNRLESLRKVAEA